MNWPNSISEIVKLCCILHWCSSFLTGQKGAGNNQCFHSGTGKATYKLSMKSHKTYINFSSIALHQIGSMSLVKYLYLYPFFTFECREIGLSTAFLLEQSIPSPFVMRSLGQIISTLLYHNWNVLARPCGGFHQNFCVAKWLKNMEFLLVETLEMSLGLIS